MSLSTLKNVIECLREAGRFVDEEGEMTNALEDLLVKLDGEQAIRANELIDRASADPDVLERLMRELVWRRDADGVSRSDGEVFSPNTPIVGKEQP